MPALSSDTLVLQVRKELIETGTTTGQWDDTEIKEFLQEGNEVLTAIAEVEDSGTATTTPGVESVALPANLGAVLRVWVRESGTTNSWLKLREADIDERVPDQGTGSGRGKPTAYLIFGGLIYLLPVPDKAYDLNILGYKAASDLTPGGSVTPVFTPLYHYLLKLFAVARCKQKMDDPGYANYDAQYVAGLNSFRTWKLQQEHQEGVRTVKLVSGMWD